MLVPESERRWLLNPSHPLQQLLRRVKYRPGWEFSINDEGAVCVLAEVVDSYNHNQVIPLTLRKIPPSYTHDHFDWTRWLFEVVIMDVERHEAREFFEVDGVKVFDPHSSDGVVTG